LEFLLESCRSTAAPSIALVRTHCNPEPLPEWFEPEQGWIDHQGMVIEMNDSRLATLAQIREFLGGTADVGLQPKVSRAQRYELGQHTRARLLYRGLPPLG
jgi:hypothetical protein